jgi:hypothetical protein
MARNLDKLVFGKGGLFNKCMIFDPFMKSSLNQNFEYYSEFFNIISDKKLEMKRQFSEYLLMDAQIIQIWLLWSIGNESNHVFLI